MSDKNEHKRRSGSGLGIAIGVAGVAAGVAAAVWEYKKEKSEMDGQLIQMREECANPFVSVYNVNPMVGDLIEIQRKNYSHWAVYVGNGFVIHLNSNENIFDTEVKYTVNSLTDVVEGCECRVNNLETAAKSKNLVALDVDQIISRAYSKEGLIERDYHIFNNNCEVFATWCRYGQGFSLQSEAKEGKPLIETIGTVVNEVFKCGSIDTSLQKVKDSKKFHP